MRRRLIDNTLTFISALCVFQIVWDLFEDIQNIKDIFKVIIAISIVLIIWYQIFCKKRLLVDTFDMLKNLSQNNKLHVLREIVMVVNDQYEKSKNKYKIKSANFQYTLFENNDNIYNVKYEICLNINAIFLKKHEKILRFYAILDTYDDMLINDIPITVSFETKNDSSHVEFITLPKSATISAIDYINKFSSLYEISFQIPETIIKRFTINCIQCKISYIVKNNFSLTNENGYNEYNFFIYPNNYGKRMNKCYVRVLVPENQNYSIVCHRFSVGSNAEKIFDFIQRREQIGWHTSHLIFYGSFKPQKNAVYFIDLNKII